MKTRILPLPPDPQAYAQGVQQVCGLHREANKALRVGASFGTFMSASPRMFLFFLPFTDGFWSTVSYPPPPPNDTYVSSNCFEFESRRIVAQAWDSSMCQQPEDTPQGLDTVR